MTRAAVQQQEKSERTTAQQQETPANAPDCGFFAKIRRFAASRVLSRFLSTMYTDELKLGGGMGNHIVAHPSKVSHRSSLNAAVPDFSAEYWITIVEHDQSPVYHLEFPKWAIYAAITAYGDQGLPIASITDRQAAAGEDERVITKDGEKVINLMQGVQWKGKLCVIFRVYRPSTLEICPHDQLPRVQLIPKDQLEFGSKASTSNFLQSASEKSAIAAGKRMEERFRNVIAPKLRPLTQNQLGTQLYFPTNLPGLFPNANATYITCFLAPDQHGMRIKASTPTFQDWRVFYGYMAFDKKSTQTVDSLTVDELGGWGHKKYTLYAFRNLRSAESAGYDATNSEHKLLLFGTDCQQPGLVQRFLHHEEKQAQCERKQLMALDGTRAAYARVGVDIPGVGEVEFF